MSMFSGSLRAPTISRAFSLVEVVVALSIMLILLPLATPLYEYFIRDAREAALKQRLLEFRRAIRLFYTDNRRFPNMLFDQYGNQVDFLDDNFSELVQGVHGGFGTYPPNRRRYLARIPVDPFSERSDWSLIQAPPLSDPTVSRRPMQTATSTRQLTWSTRGIVSTSSSDELGRFPNQPRDNITEVGGQVMVMDVRCRTAGYEVY